MKKSILYALALAAVAFTSCDEGRIAEKTVDFTEDGRVAKLDVDLTGLGTYPQNYSVVLAGFNDTDNYADIIKNLSVDSTGHCQVVMKGIPESVKTLEVCVINSIRRRVVTFYTMEAPTTTDTIRIDAGSLNVGMFHSIQANIFNKQCASCHSGNSWAASLNLNEGHSYANLVNVDSHLESGKKRVLPGSSAESVLYDALGTDVSASWRHDHQGIMRTDAVGLQLIKDWIDNGAKE